MAKNILLYIAKSIYLYVGTFMIGMTGAGYEATSARITEFYEIQV